MRTQKLLVAPAVAIMLLAFAAQLVQHKTTTPVASPITSANYNCICDGMSRAELRAILGLPGRTNRSRHG
jgi:hypothetical protein